MSAHQVHIHHIPVIGHGRVVEYDPALGKAELLRTLKRLQPQPFFRTDAVYFAAAQILAENKVQDEAHTRQKQQHHHPCPGDADIAPFQKNDRRRKEKVENGDGRI